MHSNANTANAYRMCIPTQPTLWMGVLALISFECASRRYLIRRFAAGKPSTQHSPNTLQPQETRFSLTAFPRLPLPNGFDTRWLRVHPSSGTSHPFARTASDSEAVDGNFALCVEDQHQRVLEKSFQDGSSSYHWIIGLPFPS